MSSDLIYVSALREFFAEGQDKFLESISQKNVQVMHLNQDNVLQKSNSNQLHLTFQIWRLFRFGALYVVLNENYQLI